MSNSVNPPKQIRIPDKLFNDPDLRSFFERQQYILFQLWNRTGGSSDCVNDFANEFAMSGGSRNDIYIDELEKLTATIQPSSYSNEIEDIKRQIALISEPSIISDDYQLISTGAIYTTTGNQIIIVTSNVTITLNSNPKNKETVFVKRVTGAGNVTVSAGAKNIDGASTSVLTVNYESIHCVYSAPDDEWFVLSRV